MYCMPMIPQVKKYDLMSMCKSQIIRSAHYDFVQSLSDTGNDSFPDLDTD